MTRVLYLYRSARRLQDGEPTEFGYGARQLARLGYEVDSLDGAEIAALSGAAAPSAPSPHGLWPLAAKVSPWLASDIPVVTMSHLDSPAVAERLARYDAIVATTTGLALGAALAKGRGRFDGALLCLAMGIVPSSLSFLQRRVRLRLLRSATIAALSQAEVGTLRHAMGPGADVEYAGFGIDDAFWAPGSGNGEPPYALAVGNDRQRDWATLVRAWRPEFPTLKIITRMQLPPLPGNIVRIAGSLDTPAVDNVSLRALYRAARCVVVPLHQTVQPSGQSVTLQAMACGAPVVLSNIDGLWDRDRMVDGVTCRLAPPGDADALSSAIASVLADPAEAGRMGARANGAVRGHLTIAAMAERLSAILKSRVTVP